MYHCHLQIKIFLEIPTNLLCIWTKQKQTIHALPNQKKLICILDLNFLKKIKILNFFPLKLGLSFDDGEQKVMMTTEKPIIDAFCVQFHPLLHSLCIFMLSIKFKAAQKN